MSIYHRNGQGDGFVNKKIYYAGKNIGQRIVRLSTNEAEYFSFKKGFIPENWEEEEHCGAYSFSKAGFEFARNTVQDIIKKEIEPIYIDEIGPLELQEKGFYHIFKLILRTQRDIYVVVRECILPEVIEKFKIVKYRIIKE